MSSGGISITPIKTTTKINFVLSAKDLPERTRGATGLSSIPDPYVTIKQKSNSSADWTDVATTKHLINSTDPDWLDVISLDWKRQSGQVWRLDVIDFDPLNKDDVIGTVEFDVDDYVLVKNQKLSLKLPNGGTIHIQQTIPIQFRLQVEDIPRLDTGSGSDPFVECYWSIGEDGTAHLFHKTKTIDDAQNAAWDETIAFTNYQPGTNQYLTLKVFDEDLVKNDVIGQVSFKADPYVKQAKTVVHKIVLNEGKGKATITITPVVV